MKIRQIVFGSFLILAIFITNGTASETPENEKSEKKEDDKPDAAEDRSLLLGPPEDQLAVESSGGYHQTVIAPAPHAIPVPLPLAVHPGSIVLPSLPHHPDNGGKPSHYRRNGGINSKLQAPRLPPPPPPHHNFPQTPLTRSNHPSPVKNFPLPPPPPPAQSLPQTYHGPRPDDNIIDSSKVELSHVRAPHSEPQYSPPPVAHQQVQQHGHQQSSGQEYSAPKSNDVVFNQGHQQLNIHDIGGSIEEGSYNAPALPTSLHGNPQDTYNAPSKQLEPSASALTSFGQHVPQSHHDSVVSAAAFPQPQAKHSDQSWPPANNVDMPQIVNINVKCEKNLMRVSIDFDRPFYGIIFSKGHYNNANCVHLPAGVGHKQASFDISINVCGTLGNTDNGLYGYGKQSGSGTFFENTLIIQYDPQVQEVWDQARKLRCTWHDQYEKSVTFRPFPVDMLNVVRADFAGDNVGCWLQIQEGKGPWASEVSGLVKIGQTMTMVLAIKDDDNKFDMMVRNCVAHDGKRAPIQLVDQRGCVTRPKLMSKFVKIKNFGASASVLSYAYFQAFKFPDSMEVHFQCTIQICRYQCPEQCSDISHNQRPAQTYDSSAVVGEPRHNHRRRRSANETDAEQDIGVNRIIQVVSTRDLGFLIDKKEIIEEFKQAEKDSVFSETMPSNLMCMSISGFSATLVVLLSILIISCLLSAFLCIRFRGSSDTQSIISSYNNPLFMHRKSFFR